MLIALAAPQKTPNGGAITKYVPPVPTPSSFISDSRHVLDAAAHASLDARITSLQRAGLGDIAVAILPTIGEYSPNQVAVEIYRTWHVGSMANIGSAHRDVGVLILIVPKELAPNHRGECWINTGSGAEGIITDATAGTICRDSIIPHLRNRDYAGAIGAGIGALESKLRGDSGLANPGGAAQVYPPPSRQNSALQGWGVFWFFAGLLVVMLGWRPVLRYRPRKCPHCGRRMRRLDEKADDAKLEPGQVVEENLGTVDYDVWVCECGETLVLPYRKFYFEYSECRKCHRETAMVTRTVVKHPTTNLSGRAEDRFTCKACGATWTTSVFLGAVGSSSSGEGGGGSSGGGGGGGSFGGSGSSSGGGGGGSY